MLPAADLVGMLELVRECFGLAADAEVTTSRRPTRTPWTRPAWQPWPAEGGFTRVSFGMQSAVPHVLKVLERTHEPARCPAWWSGRGGLSTSLDSSAGRRGVRRGLAASLDAVTLIGPDHVSLRPGHRGGTRMWGQVRRGELRCPRTTTRPPSTRWPTPPGQAGYRVLRSPTGRGPAPSAATTRLTGSAWDWWGRRAQPPHLGDVRLWNTKHPVAWAGQIATGHLPVAGHEVIDAESRELERIMLGIRLREGHRAGEPQEPAGLPLSGAP